MLKALKNVTNFIVSDDLMSVVERDDIPRIKALLDGGANPNLLQYGENYVPLQTALLYSYLESAIVLLENKANPNIQTATWESGTLLHFAVKARKIPFIRLLLLFGASMTTQNKRNHCVTHETISTSSLNHFMNEVHQHAMTLCDTIQKGNGYFKNNDYINAILCYKKSAEIYEKQAKEEIESQYDDLYENKKRIDNSPLINYLNKRALLCYQAIELAYAKLLTKRYLLPDEKSDYSEVLEKIIALCKKTREPCEMYVSILAMLLASDASQETTNHKAKNPSIYAVIEVASSSSPLHHQNHNPLRKRKKIQLDAEYANDDLTTPLLINDENSTTDHTVIKEF